MGPIEYGSTYMVRPRMLPRKSCLSFLRMTKGSSQLLVGPACVFGEGADEGAVFDAGDVVGGGAGEEAAGPELLVELGEGAGMDQLIAEEVVLGLRAVDPVNAVGLGKVGHLFDPADEMFVGGWWGGDGGFDDSCLHRVGQILRLQVFASVERLSRFQRASFPRALTIAWLHKV